jgi:hypothetical protein
MAFEQVNRQLNKGILYYGIDINPHWKTVHQKICEYAVEKQMVVDFENSDVFSLLQKPMNQGAFNIVVMQYFLSSLSRDEKTIKQQADRLFSNIVENIVTRRSHGEPFLLMINDIDHYTVRNRYDELVNKMSLAGLQTQCHKYHFGDRRGKNYNDGSTPYSSNLNKFILPGSKSYNVALQCSSAQLILEVR